MSDKSMGRTGGAPQEEHLVVKWTGLQRRLVSWLMLEGLKVQDLPQTTSAWAVLVEDPAGRKIVMEQPLNRRDRVVLSARCTLDRQKLEALPTGERDAVALDLGLMLTLMELEHVFQRPLETITVVTPLYAEGLSRKEFGNAVLKVFRGVFAVYALVARRLGIPLVEEVVTEAPNVN